LYLSIYLLAKGQHCVCVIRFYEAEAQNPIQHQDVQEKGLKPINKTFVICDNN